MDTNPQTELPIVDGSPKKVKRGIFPRLSLKKTLDLAKSIYEIGEGEPVKRVRAFDKLGRSAESSLSRSLVTISSMYGLTKGGYQAEHLSLTDLAKIFFSAPEGSKKAFSKIFDVLFNNEIFASFVEYWKSKAIPADDIAIDWLVRNRNLSEGDAKICWNVIKDNILDYKLYEELSGKKIIISRQEALSFLPNSEEDIILEDNKPLEGNIEENDKQIEKITTDFHSPKRLGANILERDYSHGRARLILPKMTSSEKEQLKLLIDNFVEIVD